MQPAGGTGSNVAFLRLIDVISLAVLKSNAIESCFDDNPGTGETRDSRGRNRLMDGGRHFSMSSIFV